MSLASNAALGLAVARFFRALPAGDRRAESMCWRPVLGNGLSLPLGLAFRSALP
jgi:hypothetical protein